MKKLPIGIQSFSVLINGGYTYVDKTELIFKLLENKTYFLSRPRRFGKSLLISTLKEIFLGNRELFKGLWIYDKHEFKKHPVIHLSLSTLDYKNLGLEQALKVAMNDLAQKNNILLEYTTSSLCFKQIIQELASGTQKTVVLIDEYDKPIIDYLSDHKQVLENLSILKNFLSILKDSDEYLQFLFITGVSKFSMVSIFSDLNHLDDISLTEDFATIVGLTEDEIKNNFADYIAKISTKSNISSELLMERMRYMYNGYCFNQNALRVYNPFSVIRFFKDQSFRNFWFETGSPSFLIEAFRKQSINITQSLPKKISQTFFSKFDLKEIDKIDIWTLLYQTGYLTIKSYNDETGAFTLDFPNNEVKIAFSENLLEVYSFQNASEISSVVINIREGLLLNDWDVITKHINILFASIPHILFQSKIEFYYHSIIHTIIALCGADIQSEVQTSTGRIDCMIKNKHFIYIVEFKMGTPETALLQIEQNEYFKPFLNDVRPKYLVGVGFDVEKKEISGWLSKEIK